MATNKRMFSNDIVGSDAFFDMPSTSQSLYFHLGMRCDDDGFVNPATTMRMTGSNKNDLDILVVKKFLLPFKNGVLVLKHHRINNNWDARDCRRTLYTEELFQLFIKENKAYTLDETKGESVIKAYPKVYRALPDGKPTETRRQNRIEENRILGKLDAKASGVIKKKTMKNYNENEHYSDGLPEIDSDSQETQVSPSRKNKNTPAIKSIFAVFADQPARHAWGLREIERTSAQTLFDEYGLEEVKARYADCIKYRDDEMCPQITSPSSMLSKMANMENFMKKV